MQLKYMVTILEKTYTVVLKIPMMLKNDIYFK